MPKLMGLDSSLFTTPKRLKQFIQERPEIDFSATFEKTDEEEYRLRIEAEGYDSLSYNVEMGPSSSLDYYSNRLMYEDLADDARELANLYEMVGVAQELLPKDKFNDTVNDYEAKLEDEDEIQDEAGMEL